MDDYGSTSVAAPADSSNGAGSSYTLPEGLITSKFWVEIGGVAQAFFKECTGLSAQTDVFEYSEGGLNGYTHKLPVRTKIGNVTLKRGLVASDEIWNWYVDVMEGRLARRTITIRVYENKVRAPSDPAVSWVLRDALPIKWVGPNFKADESAVAIDQLEFICGALDGSGALSRQTS